ncbi:hypothetical protein [Ammoniphilus sp. 3BR4]|uniref:hypothetical protein n=1 Tax=Ammoniphilus sp. 3BR4 TaxID=3158265 RepID=UPI00346581E1
MKTFRGVGFAIVLISFIGWCFYYYLSDFSSKLAVNIHSYTFTPLELVIAVMGAVYMIVTLIVLAGSLINTLFFPSFRKRR